jgi:hypothetical protein
VNSDSLNRHPFLHRPRLGPVHTLYKYNGLVPPRKHLAVQVPHPVSGWAAIAKFDLLGRTSRRSFYGKPHLTCADRVAGFAAVGKSCGVNEEECSATTPSSRRRHPLRNQSSGPDRRSTAEIPLSDTTWIGYDVVSAE